MPPPRVSALIVAYRQEAYIRTCIRSVLADPYPDLEIVLSDDASPDRTFAIMEEEAATARAAGRREVLNRNPENLGLIGHLNRVTQLAGGDIQVLCAGDDAFVPGRIGRLVDRFLSEQVSAVFSDAWVMNGEGLIQGRLLPPKAAPLGLEAMCRTGFGGVPGCTCAWKREVFSRFGPLSADLMNEDDQIGFRAQLLSGLSYLPEPLVYYRVYAGSISGWSLRRESGESARVRLVAALDNLAANYQGWRQAIALVRPDGPRPGIDWERCLGLLAGREREVRLVRSILCEPSRPRRISRVLGNLGGFKQARNLILFGLAPMVSVGLAVNLYKILANLVVHRGRGGAEGSSLQRVPSFPVPTR